MIDSLKVTFQLWWRGLWQSLRLHRCIVLFVWDQSGVLWGKVAQCFLLNGCIFLGSVLWWQFALQPASHWLLRVTLLPLSGPWPVAAVESTLLALYNVLWLLPAYLVTLIVSCIWYQEVARLAVAVKQQRPAADSRPVLARQASASSAKGGGGSGGAGAAGGTEGALQDVAQEVYRVILFLVFYLEVSVLGSFPYVGRWLNFLFLSWLYAYYCFDYKWSLLGVRLPDRLEFFQARWPFFAGFGMPLSAAAVLLSFYVGAAVLALLFPLFILTACDTELELLQTDAGGAHAGLGRYMVVPIFKMARWPTQQIVNALVRSGGRHHKGT